MGGVNDNGPPLKRVKASIGESRELSNTVSISGSVSHFGGSMAGPLPSEARTDFVGSKGVIKRVEFVRIITKALYSLGYDRSGAALEEESGINLYSSSVNLLKKYILDGNWDESVVTLHKIGIVNDNVLKSASFLILEQKFLELLWKDRFMDALKTLRSQITPLGINQKRVHELSHSIVSPSRILIGKDNRNIDANTSRLGILEELQKMLPPAIMIPESRLEHLVHQALDVQAQECYFHNCADTSVSLYSNHRCEKDQIPSHTTQVLRGHQDEVWFLQFSNNGKYLASAAKDKSTIIWEVHDGELSLKHTLTGHEKSVIMVAWSPDDLQLLTCGSEEVVRRWDVNSGKCLHVYEKAGVGLTSCGWFPDGNRFFSGLTDKSISLWDLDGKDLECWKGHQTLKSTDMAVTKDGKWIVSMSRESVILMLDTEAKLEKFIEEDDTVTSFSLSNDDKYLLVNLVNQEIHLWSIMDDPRLVVKYTGHKRDRYLIRSCFGGLQQAFIASGSEDSKVYVWHRASGKLIQSLPGHSGAVNCVSWNPMNHGMLASASDDKTIRIWGLNRVNLKRKDTHSNGVHHCNGNTK